MAIQMDDILVDVPEKRFTVFPIKYPDIWKYYKVAFSLFWTAEEIDLVKDLDDWNNKLNDDEKFYIEHILAFFANADGIVNENLIERFQKEIKYIEAQYFYGYQVMIENVHSEVYAKIIDTYISESNKKERLFNAIANFPCIKEKTDWALKYITSNDSFGERLLAFAIVEGVFFSSAFAAIYWMRKRGLLPGLSQANSLIAKDEGIHMLFACHLFKNYLFHQKPSEEKAHEIIKEACEIEKRFTNVALPVSLIGMNERLMCQYIEYVADVLCTSCGISKIYNVDLPFDFIELLSVESNGNMFEIKDTNYSNADIPRDELEFDF
jgi:ribonucleoside-diphosphate reductase subunit M2